MSIAHYLLTLDSCPYIFGSAGLTGVAASAITDLTTGNTFSGTLVANLDARMISWDEDVSVTTGQYRGSPMSFVLADAKNVAPNDAPLMSWLTTRSPEDVTITTLTATLEVGAVSFSVADPTWFAGPYPQYAWIDGEAVYVTGVVGSVVSCVRGIYGSIQRRHIVDPRQAVQPIVSSAFVWATQRMTRLFVVDSSLQAECVWIGVCQSAPRLTNARTGRGQMDFDLQAQPVWTVQSELPVGGTEAVLEPRGFTNEACSVAVIRAGTMGFVSDRTQPVVVSDSMTLRLSDSIAAAVAQLSSLGISDILFSGPMREDNGWAFGLQHSGAQVRGTLTIGNAHTSENVASGTNAIIEVAQDPEVCWWLPIGRAGSFPLMTVADAPATLAQTTLTSGTFTAAITQTMVSQRLSSSGWWYRVRADSAGGGVFTNSCAYGGPGVDGIQVDGRKETEGATDPPQSWTGTGGPAPTQADGGLLQERIPFMLVLAVAADSWALGAYGMVTQTAAGGDFSSAWDIASVAEVTNATQMPTQRFSWTLTGKRKLGDVVSLLCALHTSGVAPGPNGRMRFVSLRTPSEVAAADADIGPAEYVQGQESTYDGSSVPVVNVLALKTDHGDVTIVNAASVSRYGRTRTAQSMDVRGLVTIAPTTPEIDQWIATVGAMLWRHGDPIPMATVTVTLTRAVGAQAVYCGDVITLADYHLPDGHGLRGFLGDPQRWIVVGRTVKLQHGEGTVTLRCVRVPSSAPYAPCVRVASIDGVTGECTCATTYADGSDYAAGAYGVAGVGAFTATDKVILRLANVLTDTKETHEVLAVDAATGVITLDTPISGTFSAPAAGTWVEIVYEHWTAATAAWQHKWAFIGDASTLVIDGSSSRIQRWRA